MSKYKLNFDYRQQQARTMNEAECQRPSQEESLNEKLLRGLKKEVKHLMEESVMLKCVHEDSSSITSLCLSVDACLSYGLKRRALGLFKTRYEKRTKVCFILHCMAGANSAVHVLLSRFLSRFHPDFILILS